MDRPHEISSILWRRLDRPGHEAAQIFQEESGWRLIGNAVFEDDGKPCRLAYEISCDLRAAWPRFPSLKLEPLERVYRRIGDRTIRYESAGGSFVAELQTSASGFVIDYPNFLSAVTAAA